MAGIIAFPTRHSAMVQIQIQPITDRWVCEIKSIVSADAHVRAFCSQAEAQAYAEGYCDSRGLQLTQPDLAGAA